MCCQTIGLRERLQEAEESSIGHFLEELGVRALLIEEVNDFLKHLRIVEFLNYCPTRNAVRIRSSCLRLVPLEDDELLMRVVVKKAFLGQMLKIVESACGLPHQIDHHGENRGVDLESLTDQERDLLASCWDRLFRRMKSPRNLERRNEDIEKRSWNRQSLRNCTKGFCVGELGRRRCVVETHDEAGHLSSHRVMLETVVKDEVLQAGPKVHSILESVGGPELLNRSRHRL